MHKFTDTQGRDWNVCVNVGTIRRAKAATGIDLLTLMDIPEEPKEGEERKPTLLESLADDYEKLVALLASLCAVQMKERNIDEDAFVEAFNGDTLESATNALVEEVIDFFPQPRRDYLRAIKAATDKAAAKTAESMEKAVKEGLFEKAVDEALGKPSGGSPES
jgi:hypothetical protein